MDHRHFDSVKLVKDSMSLVGNLPVADCGRLADSLFDTSGLLDYQVQGTADGRGRPMLRLHVRGVVQLRCQRCLERYAQALQIDVPLRLVAAQVLDQEYSDDPEEPDCIAHSSAMDLLALIEDEVLLALPAYPRHEAEQCQARIASPAGAGAKVMAFSALQALKQKSQPSKE